MSFAPEELLEIHSLVLFLGQEATHARRDQSRIHFRHILPAEDEARQQGDYSANDSTQRSVPEERQMIYVTIC